MTDHSDRQNLAGRLSAAYARVQETLDKPVWRRAGRVAGIAFVAAVLGFLAYRLNNIGWVETARALPTTPVFYLIFVLRFLAIPIAELIIYQRVWRVSLVGSFPVFLRKRAYNFGVFEFSGEAYFAWWASVRKRLPKGRVLGAIKDVNILSALASNLVTLAMMGVLAFSDGFKAARAAHPELGAYLIAALALTLALTVAFAVFRNRVMSISGQDSFFVTSIHLLRLLASLVAQAGLYAVALPDVAIGTWLLFLTINMVLFRLPLIPNKELVFLGVSLTLIDQVAAPQASVAALFVGVAALSLLANSAVYVATLFSGLRWHDEKNAPPVPDRLQ